MNSETKRKLQRLKEAVCFENFHLWESVSELISPESDGIPYLCGKELWNFKLAKAVKVAQEKKREKKGENNGS